MSHHDEAARTFLGMVVLYAKKKGGLDMSELASELQEATGDDFCEYYVKRSITYCLQDCPYEDITRLFKLEVKV